MATHWRAHTHRHTHTKKGHLALIKSYFCRLDFMEYLFSSEHSEVFFFSVGRLMIWNRWDNESTNTTSLLCLQFRTIFIFVSRRTKSERAAESEFTEWQSLLSLSLSVLWILAVRFPADGRQCLLQTPTEANRWRRSGFHKWFHVTCSVLNVWKMTKRCTQQHERSVKKGLTETEE